MAKTNTGLAEYVKSKLGTPYVYGAKMELLTRAKYDWLKKSYGSAVWDSDASKIGKVCVDCSGLISAYTGVLRGSAQYREQAKKVHSIATINDAPAGVCVWKQGHIGVYIGMENGVPMCVEAAGSAKGTVKSKLPGVFTHWFECCDVSYEVEKPTPVTAPAPTPPPAAPKPDEPADWAKTAWDWAKANGITDGTRPKDGITRQEAAQMLKNAFVQKIFR